MNDSSLMNPAFLIGHCAALKIIVPLAVGSIQENASSFWCNHFNNAANRMQHRHFGQIKGNVFLVFRKVAE